MIFEAIAAIKIANEAISALKEMAGHISSVGECGSHLSKLCDAKEEIQKQADNGDSEAFWELERITQEEKRIKELMVWGGRANLLQDYETFMRNRKQMRENERKRAEAKKVARKKAIQNGFLYVAVGIAVLGVVGGAVALLLWLISLKGT
jgi:predicted ATP-dependent protease